MQHKFQSSTKLHTFRPPQILQLPASKMKVPHTHTHFAPYY